MEVENLERKTLYFMYGGKAKDKVKTDKKASLISTLGIVLVAVLIIKPLIFSHYLIVAI